MKFDTLYYNGNLITADASLPRAGWVAVKDKKIAAIGMREPPFSCTAKAIDLNTDTMLPGFIDSHVHGVTTGFCLNSIKLGDVTSLKEVLLRIKSAADEKETDEWVFASEMNAFAVKEKRMPTRFELDNISGNHPVMIVGMTFHAMKAVSWE